MLFVLYIWESFFSLPNLSFTSWREGGGGGELPLWDAKVLPVHCAAGCQVKLGSTGSVSVKKSILDGRLLPGKSVLIPGLILDQRLQQNDMPLAWKWTHSAVEIGWKCVRWLPWLVVLTLWARGTEGVAAANEASGPTPFPEQRQLHRGLRVFSRPLLSSSCKCIPPRWNAFARRSGLSCVFHKAWHEEREKSENKTRIFFYPLPLSLLNSEKKGGEMHYWWVNNVFVMTDDIFLFENLNRKL